MSKREMTLKGRRPVDRLPRGRVSNLVRACLEFNHLKQIYRQGWLHAGIRRARCESVADHTLGTALLALFLADAFFPRLDKNKLLRMALLHDFGEIYAGDIIPADGVSPARKHAREKASVRKVLARWPQGRRYIALWEEFECGKTAEARLLRQLDRLEMALQAYVYKRETRINLSRFFHSADKALTSPALRTLLREIIRLRR